MSADSAKIGALAPLVGYHLRRASSVFAADFSAAMDNTSLRQVPFAVLTVVAANAGINQGSVGRILNIKRANMVSLINDLIDKGLIERTVDPSDRRAFSLILTSAGDAALADALTRIHAHEQRLLTDLSEDEKAVLLDLLSRIERRDPDASDDETND